MTRLLFIICLLMNLLTNLSAEGFGNDKNVVRSQIDTISIRGIVKDAVSNEPLAFATLLIRQSILSTLTDQYGPVRTKEQFSQNTLTDVDGRFSISINFKPQVPINFTVNYIGYEEKQLSIYSPEDLRDLTITLTPIAELIDEVTITGASFKDVIGVPISLKTTSAAMIQMNAGGGGDFSKLMQSLPGLTTLSSFRNDLIVRGGSPTENTFFIDDIEIPYINHLSTQGSTGGTISILNSQLINEVDFIASGYPSNRPDAMSGVFNIYLADPFREKYLSIGNDPTNVFLNGSTSYENIAATFSIRKSYREYLLDFIGLAVLPSYSDYLLNLKYKLNPNSYLSYLMVGSIDDFKVNQDVNNSDIQQYLRDNLPTNQQSSNTLGVAYKQISEKSTKSFKLSYSRFKNAAQRSINRNNVDTQILDYTSSEEQYVGQLELYNDLGKVKIKYGGGLKFNHADYDVFNQYYNSVMLTEVNYTSGINYNHIYAFLQTSFDVIPEIFQLTLHNTFQSSNVKTEGIITNMPLPNINGTINLGSSSAFNFSVGQYAQLPENIMLAYLEDDEYVNLESTEFIKSFQLASGIEILKSNRELKLTVEGFYKTYFNYPFNTREDISLANFGADFGVVGNVPIDFTGEGRAYGIELFLKRANTKHLNGWVSYAISRSEFLDNNEQYSPSSWDARHIINAVTSYRFGNDWLLSANIKYQSALPYTPFDLISSSIVEVWDINGIGIRDFSQLNAERGKSTTLIDVRIAKDYTFGKTKMNIYLDLENVLADADSQQVLTFDRDETGDSVILPQDAGSPIPRYRLREIQNAEGVFIPSIGFQLSW